MQNSPLHKAILAITLSSLMSTTALTADSAPPSPQHSAHSSQHSSPPVTPPGSPDHQHTGTIPPSPQYLTTKMQALVRGNQTRKALINEANREIIKEEASIRQAIELAVQQNATREEIEQIAHQEHKRLLKIASQRVAQQQSQRASQQQTDQQAAHSSQHLSPPATPPSPKQPAQQIKASSTIYQEVMQSLSLKERSEDHDSVSPSPQQAAQAASPAEQAKTKAEDYGNRVSLTAPQIIALDTLINRMQGWTDESLPGAGEDNTPAERIIPWISGHYGASIQGKTSSNPGYKVNFSGFSVGSDFIVNDKVKLGLSYSNITSKLRVKGNKNTDGTKSHTVSIYGQYNFTKDIFTQSAIAYTVGSSKNRPNNLNSYKVSSNGIGGFVTLNKEFLLDSDISVTPRIGLRYIQSKEKDVNLAGGHKVQGAKNHYLTGIFGTTLSTKTELTDGTLLRPMLYAGLEKNFITKSNAPIARVQEIGETFQHQNTTKPQKTSYILGTGLSAKRNNLILSVSYQSSLAKKYISHHGILKLGLAF